MIRQAVVLAVAQTVLVIVMTAAAVGKIVEFGWHDFVRHFTNWAWTAQALFYGFTLPAAFRPGWAAAVVGVALLPLVTIVVTVWLGSSLLLVHDDGFVTDLFEMWPPGVVMVGNDVFHVLPVIVLLAYIFLQRHLVAYGLRRTGTGILYGTGPIYFFAWTVFQAVGAPLLVAAAYRVFFDPNTEYDTSLSETAAVGLLLIVGAAFSALPYALLCVFHGLLRPPPSTWTHEERRVLFTDWEYHILTNTIV